eukprot:15400-Eustigmatos_ZCMA.PRE.1
MEEATTSGELWDDGRANQTMYKDMTALFDILSDEIIKDITFVGTGNEKKIRNEPSPCRPENPMET